MKDGKLKLHGWGYDMDNGGIRVVSTQQVPCK